MIKICIACHKPPIPVRSFDWSAASPDYEPGDVIGHGATKEEAIEDYLAAIDAPEGAQWEEA
jgi:hypothetical protein